MNSEYQKIIFDIETDNLLDNVTKIHCLSYCNTKEGIVKSLTNYEDIKKFFLQEKTIFIGHNIQLYDIPVAEKILNVKVNAFQIDTLALSWVLFPHKDKHSLESFEDEVGVKKVQIADWKNLTTEDYIKRCENDVLINLGVWKKQAKLLATLYDNNHDEIYRYLEYISFKIDCVKEHQKLGVKLDIELVKSSLQELEKIKEDKINTLKQGMPKRPIKSVKFPPKVMFKANGEPSSNRLKWLEFLKNNNLPETHNTEVEYISDYEEPNPNSHSQLKDWLFTLGWEPEHYKYVREEGKSEMRKIAQIKSKDDNDGSVCPSILKLVEKEPHLESLDSLFVLSHRIAIYKGFLRDNKDGRLHQGTQGLTNTLRLQHTGIVNLPAKSKKYAENIRKSLIADDNKIMIGCDLSGIEDSTKRHYIYQYDPEYVESMNVPGYDPHIEIAVLAGFLTKEQGEAHKNGAENHKEIRQKAKTANFALTYKCGIPTLMRQTGLKEKQAKALSNAYWKRNKAILDVEESLKIKETFGQKWLQNPVSKFWYSLRTDKDKFSTLNQGTAVYCFDRWLYYIRNQGIKINFQIHDEWSSNLLEQNKQEYVDKVNKAIQQVNEELKLNIQIGCSIDFGKDYTECH